MWSVRILVIGSILLLAGCNNQDTVPPQPYDGPFQTFEDVEYVQTQEGNKEVILQAKKALEFENGNRELPEGIYIQFFDEAGDLVSTISANKATYDNTSSVWKGEGDVVVRNLNKRERLNTEELYWNPEKKHIYTEDFFTFNQEDGSVLHGEGFQSDEDLSNAVVNNPTGVMLLDE